MASSYNISEREEYWRSFWKQEGIYQFNPKSSKPVYCVDTPPPYVSADHLHAGHIMSYSQAEFVVRFKRMRGYEVFYPMGFDDNGLPTERFVEKKYKINKSKISRTNFIKKCLEETKLGSKVYKNLWKLLGISVDWSKTYSTINEHSQRISQWSFIDLYNKGKMIRKDEPTYWCTSCQTAVAQADLEDKEEQGFLNYIPFVSKQDNSELIIATTRPELLAACVALFIHPDDDRYAHLVGTQAIVPIFHHMVPILSDEDVDKNFGTGLMMVCTWGDGDDVKKTRKHQLPVQSIIEPNGRLNKTAGAYRGLKLKDARKKILDDLKQQNLLQKQDSITHAMNVHERCDTPVELIKAKQWFILVLENKDALLKQAEKMRWYPAHMKQRYIDWAQALKWDWCISRQRYYGVPFPVWYCEKCEHAIVPQESELPVDPMSSTPSIKKCPKCGHSTFIPEKDVMDTWMTSSLTPLIISKLFGEDVQEKLYPSSLRPQAFEIIRTWLFYTVVKSLYHHDSIPFRDIMISGHGLDSKGQKISKRLGNFVAPEKIISQYGADALRYWATGANLGENLRYNEQEVKKGKRTITKLFNAGNFCFSHFQKRNYSKLDLSSLRPEDQWIITALNDAIKKSTEFFESYQYAKARNEIDNFFWNYFCDNYLEFVKHRLYQNVPDETAKSVLYTVFLAIIKMYAPILPYITEEIYHLYFSNFETEKSIHASSWPTPIVISRNTHTLEEFRIVVQIIGEIRKYKSDHKLSLGKEINSFSPSIIIPNQFIPFIQSVAKVKNITKADDMIYYKKN